MAASGNQPVPAAGAYEIDQAASTVRFDTRAMFGLLPVRGTFTIGHGRITVADPAEESSVHVVMEAGSFESGNQQRDDHVKSSDYLDVARHPEIGFRSRRLERSGADATLHGELTVCGMTQPIAVTLGTVAHEGKRMTASGTTTIDRYAFGITKAKGMTGRYLEITLEVVAHR
ncbi:MULTISPECIES: YceI family protein [unclassified Streptomyces]|uniref:YceI family protein n=1 Tax=unclassified Streptomyces TaxID=2593676 RepID=UPI000F6D52B7|nr:MULTISPECIES: YceI family protein [unclassified Streptomyces]AZM62286.1 YceI family protein [Streptomyces sp. WAC 01438]RSM96306.1 YceI family protein [Streptomyces sp. WAC 01420]